MANLPDKLIAVGMRFQNGAMEHINRFGTGTPVTLKYTSNTHGVNGKCWEVHLSGKMVAHIREVDVLKLKDFTSPGFTSAYAIRQIQNNYLVLARLVNPCAEIPMPSRDSFYSDKIYEDEYYQSESAVDAKTIPKVDFSDPNPFGKDTQYDNTKSYQQNINKQGQTKMNANSMRDSFFREVKNTVLDITTGGFGIVTADGIAIYKEGVVSINPIVEMGVKVPAFAMRVAVDTLTEGDIIISGTDTSFFKAATETGYEIVSMSGEVKQVGNVSNMFFGKNTVLAIKNIISGTGMNPMMMAMMFSGDEGIGGGKVDMKTFAMMSMMGEAKEGGMDSNMLMMIAKGDSVAAQEISTSFDSKVKCEAFAHQLNPLVSGTAKDIKYVCIERK
jgi:hypothetical protein